VFSEGYASASPYSSRANGIDITSNLINMMTKFVVLCLFILGRIMKKVTWDLNPTTLMFSDVNDKHALFYPEPSEDMRVMYSFECQDFITHIREAFLGKDSLYFEMTCRYIFDNNMSYLDSDEELTLSKIVIRNIVLYIVLLKNQNNQENKEFNINLTHLLLGQGDMLVCILEKYREHCSSDVFFFRKVDEILGYDWLSNEYKQKKEMRKNSPDSIAQLSLFSTAAQENTHSMTTFVPLNPPAPGNSTNS
jgi:hypothetical protein